MMIGSYASGGIFLSRKGAKTQRNIGLFAPLRLCVTLHMIGFLKVLSTLNSS